MFPLTGQSDARDCYQISEKSRIPTWKLQKDCCPHTNTTPAGTQIVLLWHLLYVGGTLVTFGMAYFDSKLINSEYSRTRCSIVWNLNFCQTTMLIMVFRPTVFENDICSPVEVQKWSTILKLELGASNHHSNSVRSSLQSQTIQPQVISYTYTKAFNTLFLYSAQQKIVVIA